MRYVVTGAAGFIGSHLREALETSGHDVVAVDSLTDYYEPARKLENLGGRDVVEVDLAETDVVALLDGVDGVYHLAGQPGVRASFGPDFDQYVRRNVVASARVFEAAARAGIRVVFASSSSVYGDAEAYPTPESAVAATHLAVRRDKARRGAPRLRPCPHRRPRGSRSALLHGLRATAAARHGVCPPAGGARAGEPFPLFGDGSASRSFTFVADAVAATMAAMQRGAGGGDYNVGGGDEATMTEAVALAERLAGRELELERHGEAAGDVRRTKADGSKAERELGWRATTPLSAGLQAQWEWVAARVAAR